MNDKELETLNKLIELSKNIWHSNKRLFIEIVCGGISITLRLDINQMYWSESDFYLSLRLDKDLNKNLKNALKEIKILLKK